MPVSLHFLISSFLPALCINIHLNALFSMFPPHFCYFAGPLSLLAFVRTFTIKTAESLGERERVPFTLSQKQHFCWTSEESKAAAESKCTQPKL